MRRKLVFDAVWSSVEILDYNSQCWSRGRALVEAGFSWVLTSFGKFRNGRSLLLPLCPKKEFRFLLDLKKNPSFGSCSGVHAKLHCIFKNFSVHIGVITKCNVLFCPTMIRMVTLTK